MEQFLGEIRLFPFDYAPEGWARCDGAVLCINQNQALYTLLSDTFGGDKKDTFALPNLKGKEPLAGTHYHIAVRGMYPSRP